MALSPTLRRGLFAFFGWWFALYPAFAVAGATLLPPDPVSQVVAVVPTHLLASAGATLTFVRRRGDPRRLLRYALAVYVLVVGLGVPASILVGAVDGLLSVPGGGVASTTLRAAGALAVVAVPYVAGYYLVYEGWYGRLRDRYTDDDPVE